MRNIEALMMGPKFRCNQCDLQVWQNREKFFRLDGSYQDEDGNSHYNIKDLKI